MQTNGNGYVNGGVAGVGAPTTIPSAVTQTGHNTRNLTTDLVIAESRQAERFMPVMDIQQALARRQIIVDATAQLMRRDVDYGKIPGTERDTLFQPGADKLCNLFGIVIEYEVIRRVEDWTGAEHGGEAFFFYEVRGKAYRGEFLMGDGVGSCNSWEKKYRWRDSGRVCPLCGKEAILRSKLESGWFCWGKRGGCGTNFVTEDQRITGQEIGKRPNPDIADVVNTILKMAYKRCKISTTINATSASEFFTQDVEDFTAPEELPVDTGGAPIGSAAAAAYIAQQKIARGSGDSARPWRNMADMSAMFKAAREAVGESAYLSELERYGWRRFQDIKNAIDNKTPNAEQKAIECYTHLSVIAKGKMA